MESCLCNAFCRKSRQYKFDSSIHAKRLRPIGSGIRARYSLFIKTMFGFIFIFLFLGTYEGANNIQTLPVYTMIMRYLPYYYYKRIK
jgi:hypothetical protein